jgi:hypothetical protein
MFTVIAWTAIGYTLGSLVYALKIQHSRRQTKKRALQLLVLKTTRDLGTRNLHEGTIADQRHNPNYYQTYLEEVSELNVHQAAADQVAAKQTESKLSEDTQ